MKTEIIMYTDGSCKGNPGVGGWGVLIYSNNEKYEYFGGEILTTNNRMELIAVIKGLEKINNPSNVRIVTDSLYVKNGITIWINNWKRNNWKTSDNRPVKNRDLWEKISNLIDSHHEITCEWVAGHSKHVENDRVDFLANLGVKQINKIQ